MNLTVTPIIPLIVWVIIAAVTVLITASWGVYAKSESRLTGSWFVSAGVVLSLLGALLNPGVVQTADIKSSDSSQTDSSASSNYDVYLVIDTTSSVAAQDWGKGEPRLVGVKADADKIVKSYVDARFGVITFDSVATTRVPITNDSNAVLSTVDALQQEVTKDSSGSSISEANKLLASTLQANAQPERKAIVFFFSDGEQTSSAKIEPFNASAKYISSGSVLGYGTDKGGRMHERIGYTDPAKSYIKDTAGNDAYSHIDQKNLRNIAAQLKVPYVHRDASIGFDPNPKNTTALSKVNAKQYSVFGLYWVFTLIAFLLLSVALVQTTRRIQTYSKGARKPEVKR
jgi:Ca-activated chloride channel family protein